MNHAFDQRLVVRRPRTRLAWGGFVLGVAASIGLMSLGYVVGLVLFPASCLFPATMRDWPRVWKTHVRASRDGLEIDRRRYAREKIRTALVRHEGSRTYARFELKGSGRVDVECANDEHAKSLFAALGLDAMSATAELSVMSISVAPTFAAVAVTFVSLFLAASAQTMKATYGPLPLWLVGLLIPIGVLLFRYLRTVKLLVGADGIRIKEALKRTRFYPHAEIANVTTDQTAIDLWLKSGRVLTYDAVQSKNPKPEQIELARSIVRRINDARAANEKLAAVADDGLVLARGDKTHREWVDWLRRMGEGSRIGFREVAISREALMHMVESTAASALERLAAVVALRPHLSEHEAPRIRVAVERCAEPRLGERLRVALESDEATEIERVLADAEAEAPKKASRVGTT